MFVFKGVKIYVYHDPRWGEGSSTGLRTFKPGLLHPCVEIMVKGFTEG
jgi:hypothetical protein